MNTRKLWMSRWIALAVLAISLGLSVCWTIVEIRFNEQIYRSSTEVLFLASEMRTEAGPNFQEAKRVHKRLLEKYIERMEKRPTASLMAVLKPQYAPRVNLQPALDRLSCNDDSDVASSNSVRFAGGVAKEIAESWAAGKDPTLVRGRPKTADGEHRLQAQIDNLRNSINILIAEPSAENAEIACMDSRLASSVALAEVNTGAIGLNDVQLKELTQSLEILHSELLLIASKKEEKNSERIEHYASNVDRRKRFFSTINQNGLARGQLVLSAEMAKR